MHETKIPFVGCLHQLQGASYACKLWCNPNLLIYLLYDCAASVWTPLHFELDCLLSNLWNSKKLNLISYIRPFLEQNLPDKAIKVMIFQRWFLWSFHTWLHSKTDLKSLVNSVRTRLQVLFIAPIILIMHYVRRSEKLWGILSKECTV